MEIVIDGVIPSKKNSKQIWKGKNGARFIASSQEFKNWHELWMMKLKKYKPKQPIEQCTIDYVFSSDDHRKFDLSNKIESIQDLLVDVGILKDDNYKVINEFNAKFDEIVGIKQCVIKIYEKTAI